MEFVVFVVLYGLLGVFNVDIDICMVGNIIEDLFYGFYIGYLEVEFGLYYFDVCVVGSLDIVVIFEVDLSGLGGGVVMVFVFGILGGDLVFGLFVVLLNGMVVEFLVIVVVCVQIIYNLLSLIVDIYVNGGLLLDDFGF